MKNGKLFFLNLILCILLLFSLASTVARAKNDVPVEKEETELDKLRVKLLEKALEPHDPLTAAEAWAEAVKTRNGAWQYALLSPELQEEYYDRLTEMNWTTGTSSPWIEKYKVTERYRVDEELYRFEVEFIYTDSTKTTITTKEYITVRKYEEAWLVAKIERIEAAGEITKLSSGDGAKEKKIAIEDASAKNGANKGYDKANVIIGNKTKIYKGYTDQELTAEDLRVGDRVEVVLTGDPRLMIYPVTARAETIRRIEPGEEALVYENRQYKLAFSLPETWQGYQVVTGEWEGLDQNGKRVETGPVLKIRHPEWTEENPRQDIPIMVFTLAQWDKMQQEEFHIGAAPVGPRELGRNNQYVFALPARYNFAFPTGYEEVEEILENDPLEPLF
jgi:hypothetical protein